MFQVFPIAALSDNYIWAIESADGRCVAVVDPGEAKPVEAYLQQTGKQLAAILVTHHHGDHTGGIRTLLKKHKVPVYGPHNSPYSGINKPLHDGDTLELFGQTLHIKATPGHTLDHICYFADGKQPQLWCGDTLFMAGCGRLFEGSPVQMLEAMAYFHSLPDDTQVFCTHEYTLSNLAFAAAVEPDNAQIQTCTDHCQALRQNNQVTLPSTIGQEKQINPFMRTAETSVQHAAAEYAGQNLNTQVEVFASIRRWKNNF